MMRRGTSPLLLLIGVAAFVLGRLPDLRAQPDSPEAWRDAALKECRRAEMAVSTCELRGRRLIMRAGRPALDPKALFERLESEAARTDPKVLDELLDGMLARWPQGPEDASASSSFYFAQDGRKSRWDCNSPAGQLEKRVVFDGKLWIGVFGQQVTIRAKGTIPTEPLATYRYLPLDLLKRGPELTGLARRGGLLEVRDRGNVYRFDAAGRCVCRILPGDGEEARTYQYFFDPGWAGYAVPAARVEVSVVAGGVGLVFAHRLSSAQFNRPILATVFVVPVEAGWQLVDERRMPSIPLRVTERHPDAVRLAGSPEGAGP